MWVGDDHSAKACHPGKHAAIVGMKDTRLAGAFSGVTGLRRIETFIYAGQTISTN